MGIKIHFKNGETITINDVSFEDTVNLLCDDVGRGIVFKNKLMVFIEDILCIERIEKNEITNS